MSHVPVGSLKLKRLQLTMRRRIVYCGSAGKTNAFSVSNVVDVEKYQETRSIYSSGTRKSVKLQYFFGLARADNENCLHFDATHQEHSTWKPECPTLVQKLPIQSDICEGGKNNLKVITWPVSFETFCLQGSIGYHFQHLETFFPNYIFFLL